MRGHFLCLLLSLPLVAGAAAGVQRLDAFLNDVRAFRAGFSQTVTDPGGKVIQRGQGEVAISRPGKFRWEYRKPYAQLIVADGAKLWVYDPELEQVTVKSVDAALGSTPALLLSGVHPLARDFTVKDAPAPERAEEGSDGEGLAWVELTPKAQDSNFQRILLGLAAGRGGGELRRMVLYDSFGQVTRLAFSDVQRNPSLDPALFRFRPPAGVDVVGGD